MSEPHHAANPAGYREARAPGALSPGELAVVLGAGIGVLIVAIVHHTLVLRVSLSPGHLAIPAMVACGVAVLVLSVVRMRRQLADAIHSPFEPVIGDADVDSGGSPREAHRQPGQDVALREMSVLGGKVSHDFNNVLSAIVASMELLQSGDPDDVAMATEIIDTACKQGAVLARRMHRHCVDAVHSDATTIDLNTVVHDLRPLIDGLLPARVLLELTLDPDPMWVRTHPGVIELMTLNLVVNACDALTEGGVIEVRTAQVSRNGRALCLLVVSDDGPGMSKAVR